MSTSRAPISVRTAGGTDPKIQASSEFAGGFERWDLQHEAHKRIIGGLYDTSVPIDAALKSRDGSIPRILDVGTGTGVWAAEMARKFPECEVIGIDIVLPPSMSSQPSNLRFEIMDMNLPLALETASVDVVYARMMDNVITNYPQWLSEVSRVLCPGTGVYHTVCANLTMVGEDGTELPTVPIGEQGYTGLQSHVSAIREVSTRRWGGVYSVDRWTSWMEQNGNFSKISDVETIRLPVGPWQKGIDENTRTASEFMKQHLLRAVPAFRPTLLGAGYDEAVVDTWIKDATAEITELRVNVSLVWGSAWCVRSNNEWQPLSTPDETYTSE